MLGSVTLTSSNFQSLQWQSSSQQSGAQNEGHGKHSGLMMSQQVSRIEYVFEARQQNADEVVEKALSRAYAKLAGEFELPQSTGEAQLTDFEPLSAERAASNILGFIERRLSIDAAEGASDEQLESRLEAGLSGFKKGFAEAEEQLKALGMLNDTVAEDIGKTFDYVTEGIEDLRERFLGERSVQDNGEAEEALAQNAAGLFDGAAERVGNSSAAYNFAQKNSFSFSLTTADGDKVTIRASSAEAFAMRFSEDGDSQQLAGAYASSEKFRLDIKGELDEGELEAINELLGKVNDLAEDFFAGDLDQAFQEAIDIGYNREEISGFALRLTHTEVQRFSSAYQTQEPAGERQGSTLSDRLMPVGEFAQKLLDALDSLDAMQQERSLMAELLQGVSEQRGEDNNRLMQFAGTLQESLEAE